VHLLVAAAGIDESTARIGVPLAVLAVFILSVIDLRLALGRRWPKGLVIAAVAAVAVLGAVIVVRVTSLAIGL
jgi:hypothetical protein